MASLLKFILAHEGDSADPELLHWIKDRLDGMFGSDPWVMVALMGLFILAIPLSVGILYLIQTHQGGKTIFPPAPNEHE